MDYQITDQDRKAIVRTAQQLGVTPNELGAVLHRESGINPNIWGGANGRYYGAIQFGGPERKEAGLDPNKIGNYTLAEQMPHVQRWLGGRGYKSGMGVDRLYNTILGGNPNANMNKRDSFGNSVNSSLSRFRPGGSDYDAAQKKLGDLQGFYNVGQGSLPTGQGGGFGLPSLSYTLDENGEVVVTAGEPGSTTGSAGTNNTYNTTINFTGEQNKKPTFIDEMKQQLMKDALTKSEKGDSYDPMAIIQQYTGMNLNNLMPKEEVPGYLNPTSYLNLINK